MLHMRMSFGVIRYYKWWTAGYAKIAKNGYMNFDNNTWKREKGRRKRERERCDGAHHLKRQAIGDVSGSGSSRAAAKFFSVCRSQNWRFRVCLPLPQPLPSSRLDFWASVFFYFGWL